VDGRDKPGHDGNKGSDFLCPWGEARPSTIVLAMRPASEVCGKRHDNGTERLLSSDRGAKPAVESGLSSRSKPAKPRKKKKKGGETPTDA
jgi:hypothetical protein